MYRPSLPPAGTHTSTRAIHACNARSYTVLSYVNPVCTPPIPSYHTPITRVYEQRKGELRPVFSFGLVPCGAHTERASRLDGWNGMDANASASASANARRVGSSERRASRYRTHRIERRVESGRSNDSNGRFERTIRRIRTIDSPIQRGRVQRSIL